MHAARIILILFSILTGNASFAEEPGIPKLFFRYSRLFDANCPADKPIDPAWAQEAQAREAEFAAIWARESQILFGAIVSEFGKGFSRKEFTATLSVCPAWLSYSDPLVLNVRRYLKSFMKERPVLPDLAFVDLVFHEMLHTWMVDNLSRSSPLSQKYKEEPIAVRAHIHLMAMQIHIYTKLGRKAELEWIQETYSKIGGAYARAWSIVQLEGYENFINELRN
jgi:hypothetical protein